MPDLVEFVRWEGIVFLSALTIAVVSRLLTGSIATRGVIEGTTARGTRFVSASRVQLLIATMVAAALYLSQVARHPQAFPDVPSSWLLLFGGSQALYLGNKFHGKSSKRFHV